MTNDVKNIPELRFPEFSSEWIEKRLGDIGEFKNGLNKDKTEFGFGVPFVNLNDVFSNIPIVKENLSLVNANDKEIKDYNLVQGDTLFIRSSVKPSGVGLTKVIINNDFINTVYSGFLIRYRNFEKYNIDNNFKKYIFNSKSVRKQVIRQSTSSANTNINQEELKLIKINMPPTVEQQKIGGFFSKLDRQIELEEKKLAKLEEQKKGYMQKIFSQELRFKDENGNDYQEWRKEKLKNIAKVKTGNKNAQDNINKGQYKFFDRSVDIKYLNTYDYDEKAIIYPGEGSKFLPRYFEGKYSLHQRAYSIYNIEINPTYLYNFLLLQNNHFLRYAVGSTVKSLRMGAFDKLEVLIPDSNEQRKIGDFFRSMDELVEKQTNKIELLKTRKKGFLQKMFV